MSTTHKIIKGFAIALAIFIITIIFTILFSILSFFANFNFITGKNVDFNETYEDIKKIEIDIANSNIYIKEGNKFKVEATNVTSRFKSIQRKEILKITDDKNWFLFWKQSGDITIYIPKDKLNELEIDSGSGKTIIEDTSINKIELDQGAGKLEINNLSVESIELNGGAGNIEINNSKLNNLELEAGVGKIDIDSVLLGTTSIECGVGKIELNIQGKEEDYKLYLEKGLGSIKINNKNIKNNTYGTGENKIKIEGGIGEISIKFDK